MTELHPWNRGRNTSDEIAEDLNPNYETPGGAQQKATTALDDAKEYTDTEITALPDIVGGVGITITDNIADNTKVITATGIALPAPHAFTHVTGGDDVLPAAVAGGDSGLMTGADKTKLNGIAASANNYSHPNHSGDVTSVGDGVTAITAGVIVDADVNASAAIGWSKVSKTGSSLTDIVTRSAGDLSSGTLLAARLPALTGDITTTAGSTTTAISTGVIVNADVNASAAIDATKIGTGVVSNTELGYLDGVTSAIQTQIDSKWGINTNASRPHVWAYKTTNISISAAAWTKLGLSQKLDDNLSNYDTTLFRFTAPQTGIYLVSVRVQFMAGMASGSQISVRMYHNGNPSAVMADQLTSGTAQISVTGTVQKNLIATEYVEIFVYSAVASTIYGNDSFTSIEITRIA